MIKHNGLTYYDPFDENDRIILKRLKGRGHTLYCPPDNHGAQRLRNQTDVYFFNQGNAAEDRSSLPLPRKKF